MKCPNCFVELKRTCDLNKIIDRCPFCEFKTEPSGIKIDKIYAIVAVDEDGNEGIPAIKIGNNMIPMIGADEARLNDFRNIIPKLKKAGSNIRILKFTNFEVIE